MEFIKDIIYTNKEILPKSINNTIKNMKIAGIGFLYLLGYLLMSRIAGSTGLFSGLIMMITLGLIISNYLYIVENIFRYGSFDMDDFKNGFTVYLRQVYMVLFAFYLLSYGISLFLRPLMNISILSTIVYIGVLLVFNSLPEVIYQKDRMYGDILIASIEFIKENWIEWLIPNAILMLVIYQIWTMAFGLIIRAVFTQSIVSAVAGIGVMLIAGVVILFCFLYRAELFKILDGSTRRKRAFKRNMYK